MTSRSTTGRDRETSHPTSTGGLMSTHTKRHRSSGRSQDCHTRSPSGSSMWRRGLRSLRYTADLAVGFGLFLCWALLVQSSVEARRLSSFVVETSRGCLRSLSQPRWALYWLCVLSLTLGLSYYFMPPSYALDQPPLKFLAVKANLIYLASLLAIRR